MCASCYSLLLILLTCLMGMVAEGLPLTRQERGVHQDILAGADFLSVLIDSSGGHEIEENVKSTTPTPSTTVRAALAKHSYRKSQKPIRELRIPRSTSSLEFYSSTEFSGSVKITDSQEPRIKSNSDELNNKLSASNKTNTSSVVSVQVSSSEGDSRINKILTDTKNSETAVASEEYKSIAAEMNKSDFSVDESEPMTISSNVGYTQDYPANIQNIPNPQKFQAKDKFGHQSLVYHDQPTEYARGRSVSYSTVIQTLPKSQPHINVREPSKAWVEPTPNYRERQERHFEVKKSPNENQYEDNNKNYKSEQNPTPSAKIASHVASSSVAETNDYFVTAKYESDSYQKQFFNNKDVWKKPEPGFVSDPPPLKILPSTEKYWEVPGKPREQPPSYIRPLDTKRQRVPVVYGKPEQNYEVDESVSVMSNGRVHGVQTNKFPLPPLQADGKTDPNDNQKVGYVVEGRNYRKYRVEERTADGFIVGEYGVVSHDDGSLRGVRYTADGTINPRLIYDALMKFLSL